MWRIGLVTVALLAGCGWPGRDVRLLHVKHEESCVVTLTRGEAESVQGVDKAPAVRVVKVAPDCTTEVETSRDVEIETEKKGTDG